MDVSSLSQGRCHRCALLGFAGTRTVDAENDYVRIDGPSVWIEFSLQPGRSIPGIHPHSVWRDKTADYGGNTE